MGSERHPTGVNRQCLPVLPAASMTMRVRPQCRRSRSAHVCTAWACRGDASSLSPIRMVLKYSLYSPGSWSGGLWVILWDGVLVTLSGDNLIIQLHLVSFLLLHPLWPPFPCAPEVARPSVVLGIETLSLRLCVSGNAGEDTLFTYALLSLNFYNSSMCLCYVTPSCTSFLSRVYVCGALYTGRQRPRSHRTSYGGVGGGAKITE